MREPQWETVKRCSPVSNIERKPIPSSRSQAARPSCKREAGEIPPGPIERGERIKVISAYLGGLAGSAKNRRLFEEPDAGKPHVRFCEGQ